jgi:hypothetical protein
MLTITSCSVGHLAQIGLNTDWGGSIANVSLDGTNFVNAHDTGREVQPALYDGAAKYDNCAGCTGTWGWDPVQGGDVHGNGSPVLAMQLTFDSIYVKAEPLQWYPDNQGGGAGHPILSDCYFEETVSVVPGPPLAFKVHFVLTHFGTDQHYSSSQEFPAVYVNSSYGSWTYYGGTAPWTNGPLTTVSVPTTPGTGITYTSEDWAANVDSTGQGLTVYVPGQLPYASAISFPGSGGSGSTGDATFYQHPFNFFTLGPGAVMQGDVYLFPGAATAARSGIYAAHETSLASTLSAPAGNVDAPAANATITGSAVTVSGWTFDADPIASVQVSVDGAQVGTATYDKPRPDVGTVWPNAPVNCGWTFSLDSTKLVNGAHTITVDATDNANNVTIFPPIPVTVSN